MTGGPAVTELLKSRADYVEQPTAIRGYITGAVGPSKSLIKEPAAFPTVGLEENWLWVAAPEYSTSRPLGPCQWDAIHGSTLPAQYAACVVLIDSEQQPTVVWWEGNQGEGATYETLDISSAQTKRNVVNINQTTTTSEVGKSASALNVVSVDETFSAMQITGHEEAKGTLKIAHVNPSATEGADAGAAAISIDLQGQAGVAGKGTTAQGIFMTSTTTEEHYGGAWVTVRNTAKGIVARLKSTGVWEQHEAPTTPTGVETACWALYAKGEELFLKFAGGGVKELFYGKPSVPAIAAEGEVKVGTIGQSRRVLANLKGTSFQSAWKVKHGLKTPYVSVSIHLEAASEELKAVLIKEIKTLSENEIELIFETAPTLGKVYWVMMTA